MLFCYMFENFAFLLGINQAWKKGFRTWSIPWSFKGIVILLSITVAIIFSRKLPLPVPMKPACYKANDLDFPSSYVCSMSKHTQCMKHSFREREKLSENSVLLFKITLNPIFHVSLESIFMKYCPWDCEHFHNLCRPSHLTIKIS